MIVTNEMIYEVAAEALATIIKIEAKVEDMLTELRSLRMESKHLAQESREAFRSLVRHPEVRA